MGDVKRASAAISAVMLYIKAEEEAIAIQSAMQTQVSGPAKPAVSQAPTTGIKPWALNGRQTQMQMRALMQLRASFRR